jgi:tRNA modification GTPase
VIQSPTDPIVALASPSASGALAVVRVSGAGSLRLLSGLARGGRDLDRLPGHTLHRRTLFDADEPVDEVLVAVYQAPRSYTGEEGAEITCHGGLAVVRRLLALLERSGFRPAGPGEFTQRAFLNGRMDLTRAEAVNEIVRARTDRARGLALQRLGGAIEGRVRQARDLLVELRASLEVMIDYPEEETGETLDDAAVDRAISLMGALADTYRQGRAYQEGVAVAIAGATNSGKSSLFNLILRQDRAIVSEVHGTTRDWLEAAAVIEGIPVRLFDTAGLRESADPLEAEGMRRTRGVIEAADAVVYLVDGARGLSAADRETMAGLDGARLIRAWNKTDLPAALPAPEGFIGLSAATSRGLEELEKAIARAALGGAPADAAEPLVDSERQRDALLAARAALERFRGGRLRGVTPDLLAVDLADALDSLGAVTGEVTSAEVLEAMFSRFCVGK